MEKKSYGTVIIAAVVCLLAVAVVCVALFILKSNTKSNEDQQVATNNDEVSKVELLSEKEAKKLIEEYYDIAESLYFLSNSEFKIDRTTYPSPFVVENYEEVVEKYISTEYLEEFSPALLFKEKGKYYMEISGFAEDYDNLRFENIIIEENVISCTVIFDLFVGGELVEEDVESNFVLVKENGEWKIDEYYSDYMIHYEMDPEEVINTYAKNEKIEIDSVLGKKVSEYIASIWAIPEAYSESISEFQEIKDASKDYLAVCTAFETWRRFSLNNLTGNATMNDFNNVLIILFGENANGLLTSEDMDRVFFLSKNADGTYSFMGFDGSETSDVVYSIKSIERKDNIFYVDQYEYKREQDGTIYNLQPGEGIREYVYDRENKLITTIIIRAVQNGDIMSFIRYNEAGEEIGKINETNEYIISNFASDLTVRHIALEYNESTDSFIMISNRLDK